MHLSFSFPSSLTFSLSGSLRRSTACFPFCCCCSSSWCTSITSASGKLLPAQHNPDSFSLHLFVQMLLLRPGTGFSLRENGRESSLFLFFHSLVTSIRIAEGRKHMMRSGRECERETGEARMMQRKEVEGESESVREKKKEVG